MKKKDEQIIRYLSGLMSLDEKNKFENELDNSSELKDSLKKINKLLSEFSPPNSEDIDERYFNGLLPSVRLKINGRKKTNKFKNYIYAVPALAAVIILFFIVRPFSSSYVDFSIGKYSVQIDSIFSRADKYDLDEIADDFSLIEGSSEISQFLNGDLEKEYLSKLNLEHSSFVEEELFGKYNNLDYVNDLSDEEFEKIYNNITKTTIL